ncbi:Uncharacterised protein [Pannonibacter phragmitetus]|uniref:Bacterial CdiA-CT RNAse A domain-containing protein n=1 Tax=Pannonibacter phragmitetus TaxID=121719 RepID=A0A379HK58_9HYPH|nr:RNase A-like domain-containing protein [Pannonibacter phragmitetus]SUC82811.1 Uncharacterised protein [Pannonibacter phragmitetus]
MNAGVSYNFTSGQFGANAGVNAAQGSQSRAWVETPSGIVTDRDLTVTVGGHTQVTGGVIGSRSGELALETETLGTQDLALHETNRHVSGGVNVSVGVSKEGDVTPGGSLEGAYANAEREGIAKATIGQGTIVVRDGDGNGVTAAKLRAEADAAEASGGSATAAALREQADAEEASDKSATDTQLASLNRDLDTVIEVTRETEEGFDLYVSDTSVKAVKETVEKALEPGGFVDKYLLGKDLTDEEKENIRTGLAALGAGGRLGGCSTREGRSGFNPFDWLITPAYAFPIHCAIYLADGSRLELGTKAYEECKDAIYAYLNGLSGEERAAIVASAGFGMGSGSVGPTADSILQYGWLLTAIEQLDGQARGELFDAYMNGRADGTNFSEQMIAERWAVWHNSDLTLAEKWAGIEATGLDLNTVVAMAMLGGVVGRVGGKGAANSPIVPGGGLQAHEAAGGHLISRHVGKSDADLGARLSSQPNITAASSFPDRVTAERAVSSALDANAANISQFLNGSSGRLVINHNVGSSVGNVMSRGSTTSAQSSNVRVVLQRDPTMPTGYRIITGFPVP